MLNVEYRLKLGQDEFVIKAEVKDEKEFFETLSFYSNLPKTAPGGSTDLKLSFRTTTEGHKYYSLVSEKEKMEFKLGQNKEAQGGGLFPKGWEKLYEGDKAQQTTAKTASAPVGVNTGVAQPAPIGNFVGQAPTPQPAITPTPAAVPQQTTAAPVGANPQVTQVANNVLSRFGIKN